MGSAVSIESSLKAEGAVIKLTKEISELRESIKKNIQQKNEFFSTKITSQKQIDLQTNQVKTIEEQLKNIKDFISEVETTIETVETKQKEEKVTKKVIEAQKEAFKAVQKKTDADEALNSHRVISE
jgi:enoyl-[acyl-carrier-protein] reductase (NADH)